MVSSTSVVCIKIVRKTKLIIISFIFFLMRFISRNVTHVIFLIVQIATPHKLRVSKVPLSHGLKHMVEEVWTKKERNRRHETRLGSTVSRKKVKRNKEAVHNSYASVHHSLNLILQFYSTQIWRLTLKSGLQNLISNEYIYLSMVYHLS